MMTEIIVLTCALVFMVLSLRSLLISCKEAYYEGRLLRTYQTDDFVYIVIEGDCIQGRISSNGSLGIEIFLKREMKKDIVETMTLDRDKPVYVKLYGNGNKVTYTGLSVRPIVYGSNNSLTGYNEHPAT